MIGHPLINVDVDDLAAGERFYTAAFGLTPRRRLGDTGLELTGWPTPLYLLEKASGTAIGPTGAATRDYRRHWTPVHLDVVVDDLDAAIARAEAAGAAREGEARHHDWGSIAMFADPFGHGFCLIRFRGRGYDEIARA